MKGFVFVGILVLSFVSGALAQVTFHDNCEDAFNSTNCANLGESNVVNIVIPENDNYLADFERINVIEDCSGAGLDFLSVESPRYFSFIAYAESIAFDLEINNIVPASNNELSESGGQVAILKDCTELSGIFQYNFCNGVGFPARVHGDISTSRVLFNFEVGCRYVFLLDGISGSGAEYTITFTNYDSNLTLPFVECLALQNDDCLLLGEDDCSVVTSICENSSFSFSSDTLGDWGCVDYIWTLEDENFSTIESVIIDTVDFHYDSLDIGWYYYSLEAQHECDTITILDSFYVAPVTETYLQDTFICIEAIDDFNWPGNWLGFNGQITEGMDSVFMYAYEDECKCGFNEYLRVTVSESLTQGTYDTLICNSFIPFVYNGEVINGPVQNYVQDLSNLSSLGCDSSVVLNVIYAEIMADVQVIDCEDDSITISAVVNGIPNEVSNYAIIWSDDQGLLGSETELTIGINDAISLSIELDYLGQLCTHEILEDMSFITEGSGDFSIPSYDCYASNDTIIITFDGEAINNPALTINQLSAYTYELVNNQWIFSGMTEDDQVLIEYFSAIEGICSSDTILIDCSLTCIPYQINLLGSTDPICWSAGDPGINLEYIASPTVSVDGEVLWSDGINDLSNPWYPVDNIDSLYTIYFTLEELGCYYYDTMQIEVIAVPIASVVQEELRICGSESIELLQYLDFHIDVNNVDFSGDVENVLIDDGDNLILSWDSPGTKEISFSAYNNPFCPSNEVSITVIVEEPFMEDIFCQAMGADILFYWLDIPCIESWDVYINGDFQGVQSDTFFIATDFPSETNIEIEIIPNGDCACMYDVQTTECTTPDCPDINLSADFLDTLYCENNLPTSLQLMAYDGSVSMNALGVWSGPLMDNEGFIEISQLGVGIHEYTFEYNYDSNCLFSTNVVINIVEVTEIPYEIIQPNCYLMDVGQFYMESLPSNIESTIYIDDEAVEWSSEIDLGMGIHEIQFTDTNGCVQNYEVEIVPVMEPDFELVGETLLIEGETYEYSINSPSTLDSITWSLNDVVLCSGAACDELILSNFDSDIMELCAVCYFSEGCFKEICIELRLQEQTNIFIPNVFSPHADEKNGSWMIGTNVEGFILDEVSVYDRWGNRVYYLYDQMIDGELVLWDGTFAGAPVVAGVYVYKIHYTDETGLAKRIVGDLTLIR